MAAADTTPSLVERLTDPNYEGEFQHLRPWSEIDGLFKEAASRITELEGKNDALEAKLNVSSLALLARAEAAEANARRLADALKPFVEALAEARDRYPEAGSAYVLQEACSFLALEHFERAALTTKEADRA